MDTSFLPSLPLALSYPLLFGALLIAGTVGGEVARFVRLPRIVGYVIVGFLVGPLMQALGLQPLVERARVFVDLALGLALFDLGRRMDLQWMKREWTLAAAGLAESLLAFAAVFSLLVALGLPAVDSGIIGAICISTSPVAVMLIVQDSRAEGQVTERALNLVALNSLLASILTTILFATAHLESKVAVETALLHPAYLFLGSVILGGAVASAARVVARTVEKTAELHFTIIASMVVGAVGLATMLKLSVILALLAFGLFTRNDVRNYDLLNVNLAPASRLLYIVLFVITGASLPPEMLLAGGVVGLALAGARFAGKFAGASAFSLIGGLRARQAVGLACCLAPASTLPLMLYFAVAREYRGFAAEAEAAFFSMLIVMEIAGPIAAQWGLRLAGETAPVGAATGRHAAAAEPAPDA